MAKFKDAARKCQAHFRDNSRTIDQKGGSPTDSIGQKRSWLLTRGCEEQNLYPSLRGEDRATKFLRERGIKWWQDSANGDQTKGETPTRQMTSSQIACVNFFLPLTEIRGALTAVARAIDDDVEDVILIQHEGRESLVELEWIGLKESLEGTSTRGANSTSIDAFLVVSTKRGICAYLIEWKYVEEYPVGHYLGQGNAGETRLRRFTDLYYSDTSSFTGTVPIEELLYEPFYQIMRFWLLADRMVKTQELGITDAKVVVVVPQGNNAYRQRITSRPLAERFPELKTVEGVVKATLKDPDGFKAVDYSTLVDAVERECGSEAEDWVAYIRARYD